MIRFSSSDAVPVSIAGECSSLWIDILLAYQYDIALASAPSQVDHADCDRVCSSPAEPQGASGMVAGYVLVGILHACTRLPGGHPPG